VTRPPTHPFTWPRSPHSVPGGVPKALRQQRDNNQRATSSRRGAARRQRLGARHAANGRGRLGQRQAPHEGRVDRHDCNDADAAIRPGRRPGLGGIPRVWRDWGAGGSSQHPSSLLRLAAAAPPLSQHTLAATSSPFPASKLCCDRSQPASLAWQQPRFPPALVACPATTPPAPLPPARRHASQVKTRLELASEEANTREVADAQEVVTPEGLRYTDLKIGGGSPPVPGGSRGDVVWVPVRAEGGRGRGGGPGGDGGRSGPTLSLDWEEAACFQMRPMQTPCL
jgi:hypothetical protein